MTERGRGRLRRDTEHLQIGPSALHWQGERLTVAIDEVTSPWPTRLRGSVTLQARPRHAQPYLLSARGGHHWCPIAPSARVEVALTSPALRWSGTAYFDSNFGDAPLEHAFRRWDWSRAHLPDGRSVVLYDVESLQGGPVSLGLAFAADGSVRDIAAPPIARLPATRWGVARATRCDTGATPGVVQTLTDAPFYARSLVRTRLLGEPATALHESLSLQRFSAPWVQAMLPFRMPRRA